MQIGSEAVVHHDRDHLQQEPVEGGQQEHLLQQPAPPRRVGAKSRKRSAWNAFVSARLTSESQRGSVRWAVEPTALSQEYAELPPQERERYRALAGVLPPQKKERSSGDKRARSVAANPPERDSLLDHCTASVRQLRMFRREASQNTNNANVSSKTQSMFVVGDKKAYCTSLSKSPLAHVEGSLCGEHGRDKLAMILDFALPKKSSYCLLLSSCVLLEADRLAQSRRAWRLEYGSSAERRQNSFVGCEDLERLPAAAWSVLPGANCTLSCSVNSDLVAESHGRFPKLAASRWREYCRGISQPEPRQREEAGVKVSVRKCWLHGVCLCSVRGRKLQAMARRWQAFQQALDCQQGIALCICQLTPHFLPERKELQQADWYFLALQWKKPVYSIFLRMEVDEMFPPSQPHHQMLHVSRTKDIPEYLTDVECFEAFDLRCEVTVSIYKLVVQPAVMILGRPPAVIEVEQVADAELTLWRGSAQEHQRNLEQPEGEGEGEDAEEEIVQADYGFGVDAAAVGEAVPLQEEDEAAWSNAESSTSSSSTSDSSSSTTRPAGGAIVDAGVGLQQPEPPAPDVLARNRRRHPGSYDWGAAFSFTFRPGGPGSGATWQATCKVHEADISGTKMHSKQSAWTRRARPCL